MTDQQRIAEITARCEAATPGPWETAICRDGKYSGRQCLVRASAGIGEVVGIRQLGHRQVKAVEENAAFIAHSREDIPFLLSLLAAKDAEIERLTEAAKEVVFQWDNGYIEPYSPVVREAIERLRPLPAAPEKGE